MDRSRVGIVIPALNESATIAVIVEEVKKYGVPIVVDDGSTDNTADLARQAGALVVSHECNRGYDAALDSGFRKSSEIACEVIITLDADGQHDPSIIQKFIERIDDGADVVIGIRNKRQRLAEHCFAFLTYKLYGIFDPLCGLKCYRVSVYRALGHFDSFNSIGTELTLFAARGGYCIEQIPITISERDGAPRFGPKFYANYKIFRAIVLTYIHFQGRAKNERGSVSLRK
jgi:glycosyltransferase involved in cell wall biosynthesis